MAAVEDADDELFEHLPEGLKPGAAKTAWRSREEIWARTDQGKTPKEIFPMIHVPMAAVEWVISKRPQTTGPIDTGAPGAGPTPPPAAAPPPQAAVPVPPPHTIPEGGGERGPVPVPQWSVPQAPAEPLRAAPSAVPGLTDIQPPIAGPLGGMFETNSVYDLLLKVLYAYGLKEGVARGIVYTFSLEAEPNDLDVLRRLLVTAGQNNWVVNSVIHTWEVVLNRAGDTESPVGRPTGIQQRIEAAQRSLGLRPGEKALTPEEMSLEDLERKKAQLSIKEIEVAIQERERALQKASGTTPVAEGNRVPLVLDYGGGPVQMQVSAEMVPYYSKYIVKPGGADGPRTGEPSQTEKAILDRLDRMERDRAAQQEEDKRRREVADAIQQATAPLHETIRRMEERLATNPAESEMTKKYDALVNELRENRERALHEQLDQIRQEVRAGRGPEEALRVIDRERQIATRIGMVPGSAVGKLEEEQVQLEAEREANKTKNNAQAKLVDVATKRLDDRPIKELAKMVGVDQWGPSVIKQKLGAGPEPGSTLMAPTEEELAAEAARLEGLAGKPTPNLRPVGDIDQR